jgi:hypothetical protein
MVKCEGRKRRRRRLWIILHEEAIREAYGTSSVLRFVKWRRLLSPENEASVYEGRNEA